MSQLPAWLIEVKKTLPRWIDRVTHPSGSGRFRFAIDAFEPYDLDSSHMFENILFTTGGGSAGLPDPVQKQAWIDYLLDMQRQEDGFMIDAGMERHLQCPGGRAPTADELFALRRWTTRNGLLTVIGLGGKPRFPLAHGEVFDTPAELISHIESLDWTHPWAAGSRTGAVVLFQHFNRLLGDERADSLIRAAIDWLAARQDPETGAWFKPSATDAGQVPLHQLVNGIMKIWIQLLTITDLPVQYPERVVDLCIRGIRQDPFIARKIEACSVFDVALVLDIALRYTDHRRAEVAEIARSFLPKFEPMVAPDGAFSYFAGRSLDSHSGLLLGPVKNQSDAVGTSLHSHAIALLANLADLQPDLGWTPLTEWRMRLG